MITTNIEIRHLSSSKVDVEMTVGDGQKELGNLLCFGGIDRTAAIRLIASALSSHLLKKKS